MKKTLMTRIIKAQDAAPQSGVLKLADLAAEAQSVILQARHDAARVLADARLKADEVLAAARQKGYDEGFAMGREEGFAQGRHQAQQDVQRRLSEDFQMQAQAARRIVQELQAARDSLLEQARADMVEFAMELADKVVGQIAARDLAPAKAALDKVLVLAQCQAHVTVRVNPAELEGLQSHGRELLDATSSGLSVQWIADASVERGGVKMQTGRGLIDATIRTQLQNIAAALTSPQAPGGAAENL
jgi:flagellar assembly protein FliH